MTSPALTATAPTATKPAATGTPHPPCSPPDYLAKKGGHEAQHTKDKSPVPPSPPPPPPLPLPLPLPHKSGIHARLVNTRYEIEVDIAPGHTARLRCTRYEPKGLWHIEDPLTESALDIVIARTTTWRAATFAIADWLVAKHGVEWEYAHYLVNQWTGDVIEDRHHSEDILSEILELLIKKPNLAHYTRQALKAILETDGNEDMIAEEVRERYDPVDIYDGEPLENELEHRCKDCEHKQAAQEAAEKGIACLACGFLGTG